MKPFNLEAALAGEPVVTRDGRRVTQLTMFDGLSDRCLAGVIDGILLQWDKNGRRYKVDSREAENLFMATTGSDPSDYELDLLRRAIRLQYKKNSDEAEIAEIWKEINAYAEMKVKAPAVLWRFENDLIGAISDAIKRGEIKLDDRFSNEALGQAVENEVALRQSGL